jgi:hypothetical protein
MSLDTINTSERRPASEQSDIVRGCRAIGAVLGISQRAAENLLSVGALPARKIAGRWFASRSRLLREVTGGSE